MTTVAGRFGGGLQAGGGLAHGVASVGERGRRVRSRGLPRLVECFRGVAHRLAHGGERRGIIGCLTFTLAYIFRLSVILMGGVDRLLGPQGGGEVVGASSAALGEIGGAALGFARGSA